MKRISARFVLVLWGIAGAGPVNAAEVRAHIDLPPGRLSIAVATLAIQGRTTIGTTDPSLLSESMPTLRMSGPFSDVLTRLARRAHARLLRLPGAWQLVRIPVAQVRPGRQALPAAPAPIVVEGSKRNVLLINEPAEVVRLSGVELEDYGAVPDTQLLTARAPTLVSTHWGNGQDKLFLRGIADSSFTGPSPTLVGEYLDDQRLTFSAPDPDLRLYDLASVEILEGPQGTLYGAGSLAGLVRLQTNPPALDHFSGSAWAGLTSTDHGGVGGDSGAILNIPIIRGKLGLRLLAYDALDAGYIHDSERALDDVNSVRTWGGRAAARWQATPDWSIDLGGVVQHIDNHDAPYADAGAPPLTRSSASAQPSYNRFLSGRIVVRGAIGRLSLTSTTAIVDQSYGDQFEALAPATSYQFVSDDRATLLTHETRLSYNGRSTDWVAGVSYLSSIDRSSLYYGLHNGPILFNGPNSKPQPTESLRNDAQDFTGYGEVTRHLSTRFSATAGFRYSVVHLSGRVADLNPPYHLFLAQPEHAKSTERHPLPSAALSYALGGQTAIFARYERGFRPGGLTAGLDLRRFDGDRIETLEMGFRRGVIDRDPVAISLTGSSSHWKNIQADLIDGEGIPYIANIGNAMIRSLDCVISLRLYGGWRLDASGFVARNRLSAVPALAAEGDSSRLPNVARDGEIVSLDRSGQFGTGGRWRVGIRAQHVGRSRFGIGPLLAVAQGGYTTVAAGGDIRIGRLDLLVDATNLFDSRANSFAVGTPFAGLVSRQVTPLRPRTLRLGADVAF